MFKKLLLTILALACVLGLARAVSAETAIGGWGWSSNIGWIKLKTLKLNDAGNALSGYAWSPNIGWINFAGATVAPNKQVSGSARAIAPNPNGDSGWTGQLKLSGPRYATTIAKGNTLSGWAWGDQVIGWVKWHGSTTDDCDPLSAIDCDDPTPPSCSGPNCPVPTNPGPGPGPIDPSSCPGGNCAPGTTYPNLEGVNGQNSIAITNQSPGIAALSNAMAIEAVGPGDQLNVQLISIKSIATGRDLMKYYNNGGVLPSTTSSGQQIELPNCRLGEAPISSSSLGELSTCQPGSSNVRMDSGEKAYFNIQTLEPFTPLKVHSPYWVTVGDTAAGKTLRFRFDYNVGTTIPI